MAQHSARLATPREAEAREAARRSISGVAGDRANGRSGTGTGAGAGPRSAKAPALRGWRAKALQYGELLALVVDQTERRVLRGEKVPAQEKVASLFEPHTDIIVKGRRQVQYGHKVNLSTGASGLVLDAVVERGNSADSSRGLAMIERHAEIYGSVPEHGDRADGQRRDREPRTQASPPSVAPPRTDVAHAATSTDDLPLAQAGRVGRTGGSSAATVVSFGQATES